MRHLLIAALLITASEKAHAFGQKKMNLSEVKGVTETQLVQSQESAKLSIMVRGKGAEFLFRTLKEKRTEQVGSAALELAGNVNNTHWTVQGKQVTCSRIQNEKNKKEDFACAFELDAQGNVAANVEPFSPNLFNLVKTKTQAKLFPKKNKGRGLASAVVPHPTSAYAMYEKPGAKSESEDTLFVFHGPVATEMMSFLTMHDSSSFHLGGASGVRGREISCVAAKKAGDPDRCALVVSLNDGSVSTRKNPLFK
jgi:hypothetical protein